MRNKTAIRITADIDNKDKDYLIFSLMKAVNNINKIEEIKIIKSNSKGWHIIIWSNEKYNLKEIDKLRKKINDDRKRIRLDHFRKLGRNTLFSKKIKLEDIFK